jgi:hypothetical protein
MPALVPTTPPSNSLANMFSGFWSSFALPMFGQKAVLLVRINSDMAGATPTSAWDPHRAVTMSFGDGSYGVGWQLNGRLGYLAPQYLVCGKNDNYKQEEVTDSGLILYQGPMVLYQPPPILRKGDVLVFSDGRYVVGDQVTPAQVMGQTIISGAKLEARSPDDIIYTIPLS